MIKKCPCGGIAHADFFLFPKKDAVFFLRCESCSAISDKVKNIWDLEEMEIREDQSNRENKWQIAD
jgi:hypothetical protein